MPIRTSASSMQRRKRHQRTSAPEFLDLVLPASALLALIALFVLASPTQAAAPSDEGDTQGAPEVEKADALIEDLAERVYGSLADLESAAADLRQLESSGGWPKVSAGAVLEMGASGARVREVRQRLIASEDASFSAEGPYDQSVADAVTTFQRRHGLLVDGKVGPETLAAMNVSAGERAAQLELNLRRRADYLERREGGEGAAAILVNLPAAEVHATSGAESDVLSMKAVIGKAAWATPELRETLEHIVVNPYWYVPIEILAAEIKDKVLENPSYLAENNMEVVNQAGPNAEPVDASTIDWAAVDAENPDSFPYYLRRKPGSDNPLGRIKFMMPNQEDIYLHDTPAEQLFERDQRALSHGCIRLERPLDLAAVVLSTVDGWDSQRVEQQIASGEHEVIVVEPSVPVDLVYWTAWVNAQGKAQFRPDVYDRDES